MARAAYGMEVLVRWHCGWLACETRDAGEAQGVTARNQLALGEEPVFDENQERRRITLGRIPSGHAVARCDGTWICTAAGPPTAFRACLSHQESQDDAEEEKMGPGAAKGK